VEKQAKEAEKKARELEKARKQEVKTKKAQEVAKSKAMMATFFGKPKVSAAPAAVVVVAAAGPSERRSSVGKEVEVQVARAKSRSESGEFVPLRHRSRADALCSGYRVDHDGFPGGVQAILCKGECRRCAGE
jgi:hypothetical protein